MPTYAFGPFVLDPAERRLTRDGRRVAVPGKGLADPAAAGRGGRPAGAARDVPGEALAQRRGRGPHAHRPCVDPAQGARSRSGRRISSRRSPGQAIGWPCRCASLSEADRAATGRRRAADGRSQAARGAALLDARPGRSRHLSRGRHCRRGEHGCWAALPGLTVSPVGAVEDLAGARDRSALEAPAGRRGAAQRRTAARLGTPDRRGERPHAVERAVRAVPGGRCRVAGRDRHAGRDLAAAIVGRRPWPAQLPPASGGGLFPAARGARPSQALHAAAADEGADPVRTGAGARSRLCHGPCRARVDLPAHGVDRDVAAAAGRRGDADGAPGGPAGARPRRGAGRGVGRAWPREDGVRLGLGRRRGRPGACRRPQFQLGRSARHLRPVPERDGPPRRSDRGHGAGAAARSAQRRDAAASRDRLLDGGPGRAGARGRERQPEGRSGFSPGALWAHDDSRPARPPRRGDGRASRHAARAERRRGPCRARRSAGAQPGLAGGDGRVDRPARAHQSLGGRGACNGWPSASRPGRSMPSSTA